MLLDLRIEPGFDKVPIVAVTRYGDEKRSLLDMRFSGVIGRPKNFSAKAITHSTVRCELALNRRRLSLASERD